ncbi:hypothetical protein [Aquabacterium sp.]|uniref:hypothetical protein n=1 Tax=Aquabacterium sp. TaxID=1872578 RepID=UPI0037847DF8
MDMRLPAGLQAADASQAALADAPPPLRLLQRWQPAAALPPLERRTVAALRAAPRHDLPRWRLKLQQLFGAA